MNQCSLTPQSNLPEMIHKGEVRGLAASVALMETGWVLHEKREYGKAQKGACLAEGIVDIAPSGKEIAREAIDLRTERRLGLLDSARVTSAALKNAVLVTRDDDLRRRVEDVVPVRTPEQILKERNEQ